MLMELSRSIKSALGRSAYSQSGSLNVAGRTVIIAAHAGGLGDHLAYSALPRLYKYYGAGKVLVSTRTNAGEPFTRNPEIAELIWKRNPFVDGFTDAPANTGELTWPPQAFFQAAKTTTSPTDTVAKVHGLSVVKADGITRLVPPKPDLFYKPRSRRDFADTIVCDPRSTSQAFSPEAFSSFVDFIARWHGLDCTRFLVLNSPHSGNNGATTLPDIPRFSVRDIFEYTDIIASSQNFLVTESGGQSLAAAVRSSGTFVLATTRFMNERYFLWPGNTYCVTGQMTLADREWPT